MSDMERQKTIAIIPARGGSKGIPRKNTLLLGSKPLVAWPIELAKSISQIDRVIVTTDDREIADIASNFGAEVPFLRPAFLSGDAVPTLPVLQHVIEYLNKEENYQVDNVILLYPTSPFLRKDRVEAAIEILNEGKYETVIGVRVVRGVLWQKDDKTDQIKQFYPKERVNRQLFNHLYEEAGNMFFTKARVLMEDNEIVNQKKCQFVVVTDEETIDIDTKDDLKKAQTRAQELQL